MYSLPICLGCGINCPVLGSVTQKAGQQFYWGSCDGTGLTPSHQPLQHKRNSGELFSQCWKKHYVQISGFCRPTETSIITKRLKFRAILGFFIYIFIYIHTQTHTKTSAQLHVYRIDLGAARRHVCICWLIFLQQQQEERDKTPHEGGNWKEPSEWPPQNIHLSGRQRNPKRSCHPGHGGRSLLLMRLLKQK